MAYVYQEFPRWLYTASGDRLLVETAEARDAALADGWQLQPVIDGVAVLTPAPTLPPRRGRPRKARPEES